jgi:hypothetical protein
MFSSQCEAPKKIVNRLSCPSLDISKLIQGNVLKFIEKILNWGKFQW